MIRVLIYLCSRLGDFAWKYYEQKRNTKNYGFTPTLKKQCLERDNYKCVKCSSDLNIEIDHIKELIDGGDNTLSNLQTLCRKCHRQKTTTEANKRKR